MRKIIDFLLMLLCNFTLPIVIIIFAYSGIRYYLMDDSKFYIFLGLVSYLLVKELEIIRKAKQGGLYYFKNFSLYKKMNSISSVRSL